MNIFWPRVWAWLIDYLFYLNIFYWSQFFNKTTFLHIIYNFKFYIIFSKFLFKKEFFFFNNKKILYKFFFLFKFNKKFFFFLKNNFFIFTINHNNFFKSNVFFYTIKLNFFNIKIHLLNIYKRTFGEGFIYIRGLFLLLFIDACITDDEPLWEPLEWSLVQTWIFFIFLFAWIAENLISSRYGNYTGRDKRIWFSWYKTFWLIEFWYLCTYLTASCFVIVPFYYEITYNISFVFSWWNWYTRVFLFKFISSYAIILCFAYLLLLNIRWLNWRKNFVFILIINFFLAYLLYTHFIISFFGYFTDPLWYQKTRLIDHIQLSHEPLKWGWGPAKRDHFSYHKTSTNLWFKNDGPFASSFLMIHLFLFLTLFFLYLYWLVLLRKLYVTKEISYTLTTYCVSSLRQFFILIIFLYLTVFISFLTAYWRFPIEFTWMINSHSWMLNFLLILKDYLKIFF